MESHKETQVSNSPASRPRERSTMKRKAIKFTKIVSLVGIRHATDERNSALRKCIWIAWLMFGLGFAVFQIHNRIHYYLEYQSQTVNKINESNEGLRFPQVTICNENVIMPSKKNEKKAKEIKEYVSDVEMQLEDFRKANDSERIGIQSNLRTTIEKFHIATKDWENLSKDLSQTLNDTIVKVSFNGVENDSLVEEIVTDLGHCFAFGTANIPLKSTSPGAVNGLTVVLKGNHHKFPTNSTSSPGYKILIHDPHEYPLLKESGFSLKAGVITRVTISLKDVDITQQNKCDKSNDYSVVNCQANLEYKSFVSRCHCRDLHMRVNGTICSFAEIINCTRVYESQLSNVTADEGKGNDKSTPILCQPQCHSRIFTDSITESSYPLLMNEYSKIPGDAQIRDRFRVQVYYSHLSHMKATSVEAYKVAELVCDISGALSLLLGATLLTVYEGLEFFILSIKDYFLFRFGKQTD